MDKSEIPVKVNGETEDRISKLPDPILSSILAKLTMKDVVKTSVLSKRWRYLGMLRDTLHFDTLNMFGSNGHWQRQMFSLDLYRDFREFRLQFVRRVSFFLKRFQGTRISSLRVAFFVDYEIASNVDQWISVAIALGAEELELLLSNKPFFPAIVDEDALYRFPCWLLPQYGDSMLTHLCLQKCILRPPAGFTGFSKLKSLHLDDVIMREVSVASLISNCLHLEELTLIACKLSSSLKIFAASLRRLEIRTCLDVLSVQISAVNLTAFEYFGDILKIASISTPRLVKTFLFSFDSEINYALSQLAVNPQLEVLGMYLDADQRSRISHSMPLFRSLKRLELFIFGAEEEEKEDLLWVLTFLNAAPLLEKIELTLPGGFQENQKEILKPCGFAHNRLKQVEMLGCAGNWYEIEFVKCILKNAVALDRVILNPLKRSYIGGGQWMEFDADPSWFESRREVVLKSLQNDIPAAVNLEIL